MSQSLQNIRGERRTSEPEQRPLRGASWDQRDQRAPRRHGRVCAEEQRRPDGQASWDQQQASLDRQRRRRVIDVSL